jgi:hypothetical protein
MHQSPDPALLRPPDPIEVLAIPDVCAGWVAGWLGGWSGRLGRASMSFLRNDKRYGNVERCHALGPRSQNIPVRWQPIDM